MSVIIADCVEYDEVRKLCVAEENGRKYLLDNGRDRYLIRKVKLDGCVAVPVGNKQCDFLFSVDAQQSNRVFFVELKGGDVLQALKQINDTIDFMRLEFAGYRIDARIVSSKGVPYAESRHYKRLLRKVDPTGGNIKIATNKFYKDII
jgi:hypothetical protein